MDPLARIIRKELKKRGIYRLKVVYSKEQPAVLRHEIAGEAVEGRLAESKKQAPGSLSFVPSVMGLILAGEVIKDIAGIGQ